MSLFYSANLINAVDKTYFHQSTNRTATTGCIVLFCTIVIVLVLVCTDTPALYHC